MGRLAIVAVLVALVVAGAWFFAARARTTTAASGGERKTAAAERPRATESLDAYAADPAARVLAGEELPEAVAIEDQAPESASPRAAQSLEVLVTYDESPLAGAEVRVVPLEETSEFLVGGAASDPIARASTDPAGVARFELEGTAAVGIAAVEPGGATGRTRVVPTAVDGNDRVALALGSASLEGLVRGVDGAPAADTRVLACQRGPDGAMVWFTARTDATGSYRLEGLAGGAGRIFTAMPLDLPLGETRPFALAAGETKRLDFGSLGGRGSWSGTFRAPDGAVVAGPERLFFVADASSSTTQSYFDDSGRFLARLPAGVHTAHLATPTGAVLGRADVSGEIDQDLVAPPTFLHGRIRYVGSKHPVARGPEDDVELRIERADGTSVAASMRGASSYGCVGLEPGTYTLAARPWPIVGAMKGGAADGKMRFEISPGTSELEIDLAITDP